MDSSTQSTKAEVRELYSGAKRGLGRATHPITQPPCSEQDPGTWWSALVDAFAQLGEQLGDRLGDVVAVSVAGQQHGLVVTDALGDPLRPAKLWNDTESAPQAARLVGELGPRRWAEACGSVPVAAFTITKLAWLAEHEPEVLAATERIFLPHDWLTFRLTGAHVTDRGDASGTGWYDASVAPGDTAGVRTELLEAAVAEASLTEAGPPPGAGSTYRPSADRLRGMLPRVLPPAAPAGHLTSGAAAALGLPERVLVGPGTGDNMAAALGLGLAEGDVTVSLGTSGTVYSVASQRTADRSGAVAGFADATGCYLPLVCTLNATRVTDTVAGWLGVDPDGLAELALAADPRDERRPALVPYFDGERTPDLPDATGSITGLRTDTSREQLALAAHDGVLRGLLAGLDSLRSAGVAADGTVHLVGGGARSAAWRQRLAELLGDEVVVPHEEEAVAAGAAVQAAVMGDGAAGSGVCAAAADPGADAYVAAFAEVAQRWQLGSGITVVPRG